MMMMMFERMLQEQREMLKIMVLVEWLMQRNGKFNGEDLSKIARDILQLGGYGWASREHP